MASLFRRHGLVTLTLVALALAALTGCAGDDPAPDPVAPTVETTAGQDQSETAVSQAERGSGATAAASQSQTDSSANDATQADDDGASQPAGGDAPEAPDQDRPTQSALTIDRDTIWRDVYETLTDSERACVRDRLGDETEAVLARTVFDDGAGENWHAGLFDCLSPETGRELLLGAALVGMAEEGLELDEEGTACLREVLSGVDPAAVMAATVEDDPAVDQFFGEFGRCLPELLFTAIAQEIGVDVDAASEPELACLREWSRELDVVALLDALEQGDEATLIQLSLGVFRCSPSLLLASFGDAGLDLDDEEEDCVRRLLDESQASDLVAEGSPGYERFYAELLVCLPALSAVTGATSAASDPPVGPDDHANLIEDATAIDVGVEASGELATDGDFDFFVFAAEQGVLYDISVGLVTLSDSVLALYDADWRQLAFNDDHAGTLASRLYWLAEYTGDHYLEVWGYGLGAYTLLVEAR